MTAPIQPQAAAAMTALVQSFQTASGLTPDGVIGAQTWQALLRDTPAKVTRTNAGAQSTALSAASAGVRHGRFAPDRLTQRVPASASARGRGNEIPSGIGAG